MKTQLNLRRDLTCSICLKDISDPKEAHVFWRSRKRGVPMIAVAHVKTCDTPDLWRRYSTWENLDRFLDRQEEMRLYFNSKLFQKEFSRKDVKEGLERIFLSIPDEYFNVSEEDLRKWYESSL